MPLDHILHPSLLTKTQLLTKWAPKPANAFAALATSTFNNAALSKHEKELIAIGCAHTLRCPYCIDYHTSLALEAGASHEEIIEAAWVGIISETNSSVSQFPITIDALNSDLKSYQTE
ncbi:carboxymuconolactone decarboxylase family protein, partial [Gammaproteobacteria bacterium]|nr:carboxymuconolactone decarboxylase family protein [Gammaproteobacteria bacterium]